MKSTDIYGSLIMNPNYFQTKVRILDVELLLKAKKRHQWKQIPVGRHELR